MGMKILMIGGLIGHGKLTENNVDKFTSRIVRQASWREAAQK
jgi:hypothetical protein